MTTSTPEPEQLSEADVKRMYANKEYAAIVQARLDGRCDDLLGITQRTGATA